MLPSSAESIGSMRNGCLIWCQAEVMWSSKKSGKGLVMAEGRRQEDGKAAIPEDQFKLFLSAGCEARPSSTTETIIG